LPCCDDARIGHAAHGQVDGLLGIVLILRRVNRTGRLGCRLSQAAARQRRCRNKSKEKSQQEGRKCTPRSKLAIYCHSTTSRRDQFHCFPTRSRLLSRLVHFDTTKIVKLSGFICVLKGESDFGSVCRAPSRIPLRRASTYISLRSRLHFPRLKITLTVKIYPPLDRFVPQKNENFQPEFSSKLRFKQEARWCTLPAFGAQATCRLPRMKKCASLAG